MYFLPCQSSALSESNTMHVCGAADAEAGVWQKVFS